MADLVDWQIHEKLREDLMASLARTPPPGYAKVDLGQVRGAEETAFKLLARLHREYIMASRPLPSSKLRSSASRSWQRCLADGTQEEGTG